jgi:hypothetical protein
MRRTTFSMVRSAKYATMKIRRRVFDLFNDRPRARTKSSNHPRINAPRPKKPGAARPRGSSTPHEVASSCRTTGPSDMNDVLRVGGSWHVLQQQQASP